jgi:hypothetical protein
MATEIKVWEVVHDNLVELQADDFASDHLEKDLETWITNNPSLLGGKLLPIKRQYDVPGVGILDLLCIDESGRLVVVEFKRDSTSREAVAQALDYASWLDGTTEAEIRGIAQESSAKPIEDAFLDFFGSELQSLAPQNHRILVVAPRLDSSAERIIDYLSDRYGVEINAVFFRYAKTSQGQKILVRTVLVQDRPGAKFQTGTTAAQLLAMAKERNVSDLLSVCRSISSHLKEYPESTYKGSFRYWLKGKMVLGVNVSGARDHAPDGELHIWIPPKSMAEVSAISESEIRQTLKDSHAAYDAGDIDTMIALKTTEQAKSLVHELQNWAAAAKATGVKTSGG